MISISIILLMGSFDTVFIGNSFAKVSPVPFTIPNCVQPPSNVDLTTLSTSQLRSFGLPGKPSNSTALDDWKTFLQHAKHRDCQGSISNRKHTTEVGSANWAGNMATGGGYSAAYANWYVPCVNSPSDSISSPWVGIGGYPSSSANRLIQSGIDVAMTGPTPDYVMWTENYPDNPIDDASFHPSCGDLIWATDSNDYLYASEAVEDVSKDTYFSNNQSGSSYVDKSSISAEWIVEGFVPDGIPLTNFGSVNFYAHATQNGVDKGVGSLPHDYSVMCTEGFFGACTWGTTQLAHPGSISSDGHYFTVYWDHS